jgi:hypothetical protein
VISVIEPAFLARLMSFARRLQRALSRRVATGVAAIHLPDITVSAEVKQSPASRAAAFIEGLVDDHGSTRTELLAGRRLLCEVALVGVRQSRQRGLRVATLSPLLFGVRHPEP